MEKEEVLMNIMSEFIKKTNKEFNFCILKEKKEVLESYSNLFLKNLSQSKKIPIIAPCIYFTYLVYEELQKRKIDSKIVVIMLKEKEEIKVHFSLKLLGIFENIYIEYLLGTLYIQKNSSTIIQKEKPSNHILKTFLLDPKHFPNNFIRISSEELCGWKLEPTLENISTAYKNFILKDNTIQIKLKSYK